MAAEVNHYSDFSEYIETEDDVAAGGDEPIEDDSSDDLTDPTNYTPSFHAQQAQNSMQLLKKVVSEPGWKKITKHKSGLTVWSKPGIEKKDKVPVLKGEYIIRGFPPQAVFAVISMRKLWDEWYEEGNLIENLNETTSLTYMVMKGLAGSKTRDLSLVEKIECTPSGVIYFVSTSVNTSKVPRVANRIRAQLKLNGWILDPVTANPPTTKLTYVLQTNVKGLVPSFAAKKYLSRRPLVILNIDSYLQRNGPPPMVVNTTTTSPRRPSQLINLESNHANRPNGSVTFGNEPHVQKRVTIANIPEEFNETPFDIEEDDLDDPDPQSPIQSEISSPVSAEFPMVIKTGSIRKVNRQQPMLQRKPSLRKSTSQKSLTTQNLRNDSSFLEPQAAKIEEQPPIEQSLIEQSPIEQSPIVQLPIEQSPIVEPPIEQPPIVQHRHKDGVLKAFTQLKSYAKTLDGWNFFSENKGVKIYMKDIPGQSMPAMRGEAVISGGWTAEDVLQTILNLNCRGVWDDRFEDGTIFERLSPDDILLKTSIKGTFPISARDFCTVASTERDSDTGVIWNVGISVVDPLIPEGRKHVRGDLHLAGWILRPRFDDSGFTNSVHVTYIVDIDIKLDSIPSSILKAISTSTPLCIAKIDEYLQKNGCPPYLRKVTGTLTSTEFDTKTSKYDLKITDISGGKVELCVNKKTYSTGFDISVQPEEVKTELLPDNNEVIRITIPEDDNIKTLSIKLTKQTFRGFKMTLNGKHDLPIAQEQNVKPSIKKQRSRSMVLPLTLAESKPEASNHKTTEEQTSPKQKTPTSTTKIPMTATTKTTTPTTTMATTTATKTMIADSSSTLPSVIQRQGPAITTTATKTTTADPSSTSPSVIQRQGPLVADVDLEQPRSAKKDLVVLGETLRFNSQQAGLMFASMLLAYYAGKLSGDQ